MTENRKKLSVVIPTYNEEENVEAMTNAVRDIFERQLPQYDFEIIYIDNHSKDGTRQILRRLCAEDKRVKAIFNAKNFGQMRSPVHGLKQAMGDAVIRLNADFQDPPELIPVLVSEWEKGNKIVIGIKNKTEEGFLIGFLGSLLFLVFALILAFTAGKQMTGAGGLPSWMDTYMRRSEISGALASYTQTDPMNITDILRIVIRLLIMPFISMAGAENRGALLLAERLSPVLVLLPAIAYGAGYLQGPARRKRIHTEIAANAKKRRIREKREKRSRISAAPKGPQQLN